MKHESHMAPAIELSADHDVWPALIAELQKQTPASVADVLAQCELERKRAARISRMKVVVGTISGMALGCIAGAYVNDTIKAPVHAAEVSSANNQGIKTGQQRMQPTIDRLTQAAATDKATREQQFATQREALETRLSATERKLAATVQQRDHAQQGWKASVAEGNQKLKSQQTVMQQRSQQVMALRRQVRCYSEYKVDSTSIAWGAVRVVRSMKANCG